MTIVEFLITCVAADEKWAIDLQTEPMPNVSARLGRSVSAHGGPRLISVKLVLAGGWARSAAGYRRVALRAGGRRVGVGDGAALGADTAEPAGRIAAAVLVGVAACHWFLL